MKIFKLTVVKTCTYEALLLADSLEEAISIKDNHSTNMVREKSPKTTILDSNVIEHEGDIISTDVFNIMNPNEILVIHAEKDKDKYPFLCSMYDPCDPGHTEGVSDYFIDQLTDMITLENKEAIMKEIKKVVQYDEIIVRD